jgi:hypothetical protein
VKGTIDEFQPWVLRWDGERFCYFTSFQDPIVSGWERGTICNGLSCFTTESKTLALMLPLVGLKVAPGAREQLEGLNAPCEKTTKLKALAELCRAIDDDTCLIDVQCARDEELLNQWRAAWKGEL